MVGKVSLTVQESPSFFSRARGGEKVEYLADAGREVEGMVFNLQLAGLDLREIEDVVDDGQERITRDVDGVHVVTLLVG